MITFCARANWPPTWKLTVLHINSTFMCLYTLLVIMRYMYMSVIIDLCLNKVAVNIC